MKFEEFCSILNRHIFENDKKALLKKIAENPERFLGLFRPSKPSTKILQNLLQSHEIRMGDALEEILRKIIEELGFKILSRYIEDENGQKLIIDQYFTDGSKYYFIEQKIRDDHDSTKKRGQISNFKTKLEILYRNHRKNLIGIMYFIDPDLTKNKNYYLDEISKMKNLYDIDINLFYGKELFEYFNIGDLWNNILEWLKKWKEIIPDIPDINFDSDPQKSFEDLKDTDINIWKKIIDNELLWEEGIINSIFKTGKTLELLIEHLRNTKSRENDTLADNLALKLKSYYK